MKWKPVIGAKKARGNFFFTEKNGRIRIWFGDPGNKDAGSEFTLQTSVEAIPELIAMLRFIQDKERQ